jgi:hypothetical protein
VSQACGLLGIGWDTAQEIMRRAVQRGLERRQLDRLKYLGDLDDVRTYGYKASRAAALIYAHFKKEFGMPLRR